MLSGTVYVATTAYPSREPSDISMKNGAVRGGGHSGEHALELASDSHKGCESMARRGNLECPGRERCNITVRSFGRLRNETSLGLGSPSQIRNKNAGPVQGRMVRFHRKVLEEEDIP